jgi:pre-mRNA-processing factor 40
MTPMERADASTRWKEHRAPDGRVYYYHQDTRETRWSLPDDLRMAREAAALAQSAIAAAAAARSAPKQTANAAAGADGNATGSPAGTATDAPSSSKRAPRAPRDPNAPPRVYADKDERKACVQRTPGGL